MTAAGGFGVEQGLAGGDGADGADQVGAADLLEDVAGGAGHDGVEEGFVVAEAGEHEAGELGHFGAQVAADADAVAVGEADVQDGDVGFEGGDAGQGGGGGAGFADDGEVGFGFEEVADAPADDLMIIKQEHPDRLLRLLVHPTPWPWFTCDYPSPGPPESQGTMGLADMPERPAPAGARPLTWAGPQTYGQSMKTGWPATRWAPVRFWPQEEPCLELSWESMARSTPSVHSNGR